MKEQLISFKLAKLAKEKGFILDDELDQYRYNKEGILIQWNELDSINAPTQSLLQKWIREIHNIFISTDVFNQNFTNKLFYCYNIRILNKDGKVVIFKFSANSYNSYEKVLEEALEEALKLIK